MRERPFAVEGTGDLSELLLRLGRLPAGEIAGRELFRLKIPMMVEVRVKEEGGWRVRKRNLWRRVVVCRDFQLGYSLVAGVLLGLGGGGEGRNKETCGDDPGHRVSKRSFGTAALGGHPVKRRSRG